MFEVGKIYNRRSDIHGVYKGQQYGGIATPANHPYVFIFTSDAGEEFGYSDGFGPDGTFRYTGEGQEGDMQMVKGNLAIFDHQKKKKKSCCLSRRQKVLCISLVYVVTLNTTSSSDLTKMVSFEMLSSFTWMYFHNQGSQEWKMERLLT